MKKYASFCIILLLTAVLLTGCKSEEEPAETGTVTTQSNPTESTAVTSEPETATQAVPVPEEPAKPRVMLKWNLKTLLGDTKALQAGGFEEVKITRSDDTEDAEMPASLSFSFEKQLGSKAGLTISGSLIVARDASFLFDIPVDEPAGTGEDETGEDEQEEPEEELPDHQSFSPEEGSAVLTQLMGNLLEETEKGAKLDTVQSQGINWQFGTAKADDGSGYAVLNFCAAGTGDGYILYLNAGALIQGEAESKPVMERIREDMTAWMKSLCFAEPQGDLLGGNDPMHIPFAGKTLVTPAADYLRTSEAEVGFSGSDHYLNAFYSGKSDAKDSGILFNARLKNKNAMTPEEAALMDDLQGESLKGRGFEWVVLQTDTEEGSSLLAKTTAEGQEICFILNLLNPGDDAAEGGTEVLNQARSWLAELYMQ